MTARSSGTKARKPAKSRAAGTARGAAKGPRTARAAKKRAPAAQRATASKRAKPAGPKRVRAFRLDPALRPERYRLSIEVDPARSADVRGVVEIELSLAKPAREIVLHAADLQIESASARHGDTTTTLSARLDPSREALVLRAPRALAAGPLVLRIAFASTLRGDLRGLYAASSGDRKYAFTQLEAADARRFFPCFDEPSFKARLALDVTTDARNAVIANAPAQREETLANGRKRVVFEETPLLSTYLYALAVGDLVASKPVRCGKTEIRVWHVPGKEALTGFALECGRETLARLERYFDLPYPYAKLDLVAAPDFEAGAMENAGAVFFRETLLLVDEATVTLAECKRVAEVVCHELAHMWYGDLVTMAWWDDLWLNEAFATWMAFQIVDDWKPGWKMWLDFEHHRAAALGLDALANTHPIYGPVATPAEATENFDLITYEKGASVVRMIERWLGPETFRAGVRAYVRRHRESNTVAADLWRALAEASGQDVAKVARAWIETPGFPLVGVRTRRADGATRLELTQQRFHAAGPKRGGARAAAKRRGAGAMAARWPIPLVVKRVDARGGAERVRHVLAKARDAIVLPDPAPALVYGNADEGGFFRPLHEGATFDVLCAHAGALAPVERMGLVGHQWALVRSGQAPLASVLDLVAALRDETEPDVLLALRGPLSFIDDQIAPAAGSEVLAGFRGWLAETFAPGFEALGWDPSKDEPTDVRVRRAALLGLAGDLGAHPRTVATAIERAEHYVDDRTSLDANLADGAVTLAARHGDARRWTRFEAAVRRAETPQERRRFLMALGEMRERALVDRTLAATLDELVPTQDVAILLVRLLGNPAARERTWAFVKRKFTALRKRMPPMLAGRVVEALSALQTPAHRRDVRAFFRAHPLPTAERALRQCLERFDLNTAIRRRTAPELRRWLASRGR